MYSDSDVFAGTERHILDLACALRAAGAQVRVAAPSPGMLAERATAAGIQVVAIPKTGRLDRNAANTLAKMLECREVDVIHVHNGRTHIACAMAVRIARSRGRARSQNESLGICVVTQHFLAPSRTERTGFKALISNHLHQRAQRYTSHTVAISEAVRAAAIERGDCPPNAITTVYNGIAEQIVAYDAAERVRGSLGLTPNDVVIFCAARLQAEKDIPTLVRAMNIVNTSFPTARCLVAGEGNLRPQLEALISSLGIESSFKLLGFREDVLALQRACDVFVLPSIAEGFGLVLVEAMAFGKPCITTNAGGQREVVDHNVTGLVVPPSDPVALAAAISRMLANPAERESFGHAGFERYKSKFTATRMANEMLKLYRQCRDEAVSKGRIAHA